MNDWKQPICYDFDVSGGILGSIISSLENIIYNFVGSDIGPKNVSLWKELKITYENTSFKNPYDESRNVWVFADMPHLVKLLKNHILDSGVTLTVAK